MSVYVSVFFIVNLAKRSVLTLLGEIRRYRNGRFGSSCSSGSSIIIIIIIMMPTFPICQKKCRGTSSSNSRCPCLRRRGEVLGNERFWVTDFGIRFT